VSDAFAELILVDPVIMPPALYTGRPREAHYARKRRNDWRSPDEMFERFKDRPPFRDWDQAVLRDYCDYGLVPAELERAIKLSAEKYCSASAIMAKTAVITHDWEVIEEKAPAPATPAGV